jgi:hypothetical protein
MSFVVILRSGTMETKFGYCRMVWWRNFDGKNSRVLFWRWLVVLVAVFSLTASVATRYSVSADSQVSIAKLLTNHSQDPKRQHLDNSAAPPVLPVARLLAVLQISNFYPRFAPGGPPVHSLLLDKRLYNRPPPSSEFLS